MTQQSTGFQHYTTPPTFRVELAERPVLLDLLRAEGGRRLVLLDAPAGYGKTWLLTRWYAELRKAGSRVVWLGADPMEPAELLALMVAGFQRSGIDVGRLDGLAAQGFADVPLRAVLTALTATLEATPQPVVIFLDDLHRLGRDAVQDVLTRLVHEAPPTVRFVFSGRDLSMLPRADLRTRGELLEIGADQLRFGRDESRSLLPLLSKEQLDRILERTEGWPVALQLARLWLQAKPERSSLLDAFSGRTTEVAEYLTEQVLADLAPDLQKVLSEVAILDALNPALVAEVTGSPDAWRRLLDEGRLEHFLVPLDAERYWFRLHHLLLDYLRARHRTNGEDLRGAARACVRRLRARRRPARGGAPCGARRRRDARGTAHRAHGRMGAGALRRDGADARAPQPPAAVAHRRVSARAGVPGLPRRQGRRTRARPQALRGRRRLGRRCERTPRSRATSSSSVT